MFDEQLERLARNPIEGGELYFSSSALNDVLELCEAHNRIVIGIEGFREEGEKIVPAWEAIADFSSFASARTETASIDSIRTAREFLEICNTCEITVWTVVIDHDL